MKAIKNISKFFDSLTDAILSHKDTYIFGYKCEDKADYYFDDEDEETNCFYVSAGFNFPHLQKVLFETWVGDEDYPIMIVLDWYKEDGSDEDHYKMIQRLHIFWCDEDKEDNIQKWFELNGDEGHHAKATKPDATFTGLLEYIREHGNEVFCNVYDYCTNHDYPIHDYGSEDYSEFETGAREEVTMELFKRFHLEWDENGHWTIK